MWGRRTRSDKQRPVARSRNDRQRITNCKVAQLFGRKTEENSLQETRLCYEYVLRTVYNQYDYYIRIMGVTVV